MGLGWEIPNKGCLRVKPSVNHPGFHLIVQMIRSLPKGGTNSTLACSLVLFALPICAIIPCVQVGGQYTISEEMLGSRRLVQCLHRMQNNWVLEDSFRDLVLVSNATNALDYEHQRIAQIHLAIKAELAVVEKQKRPNDMK